MKKPTFRWVFFIFMPKPMGMEKQEIYGIRAIQECIKARQTIEKVWLLKGQKGPLIQQLEMQLREQNIHHSYVRKERLERFNQRNHQGAVASISPIAFVDLEALLEQDATIGQQGMFLLLD